MNRNNSRTSHDDRKPSVRRPERNNSDKYGTGDNANDVKQRGGCEEHDTKLIITSMWISWLWTRHIEKSKTNKAAFTKATRLQKHPNDIAPHDRLRTLQLSHAQRSGRLFMLGPCFSARPNWTAEMSSNADLKSCTQKHAISITNDAMILNKKVGDSDKPLERWIINLKTAATYRDALWTAIDSKKWSSSRKKQKQTSIHVH